MLDINLSEQLVKNTVGYNESSNKEEFMKGALVMRSVLRDHDKTYFEMKRLAREFEEFKEEVEEVRQHFKAIVDFVNKE